MNLIFFHSINSRSASSARLSDWLDSSAISCRTRRRNRPRKFAMVAIVRPLRRLPCGSLCPRRTILRKLSPRFDHAVGRFISHWRSAPHPDLAIVKLRLVAQDLFQDAVNDQVGIAPDRRSEVRIGGRGQREVSVDSLPNTAPASANAASGNDRMRSSGLPAIFSRQLLVHARRDVHIFGNFDLAWRCRPVPLPLSVDRHCICMRLTGSAPTPSE